ncbi:MAG: pspB [Alphaproteobacteria bacterium]|nr:pspB [Alphaproteobacteria bacterium]
MMDAIVPLAGVAMVFIGFPWVVGHYVTQMRRSGTLTREDENLLDELHELGRRLDERMCSIERIQTAENPNWRSAGCDPAPTAIEADSDNERLRRIK